MSKVIIFTGSPHKKGTTAAILDEIANGAKSKGAEVVLYDLNDKGVRGCQSCMACRKDDANSCVQNDYLKPMYADIQEADGIVLGAPIYMGSITAQAWILINRLYPGMSSSFQPRFPGKKAATVITQGNPAADTYRPAVGAVQGFFKGLGWETVGDIVWAGANLENGLPEDIKKEAFAVGERLVK